MNANHGFDRPAPGASLPDWCGPYPPVPSAPSAPNPPLDSEVEVIDMWIRLTPALLLLLVCASCSTESGTTDTSAKPETASVGDEHAPSAGVPPKWKTQALAERVNVRKGLVANGIPEARLGEFKAHILTWWAVAFDTAMPPGCELDFAGGAFLGTGGGARVPSKNPCMTVVLKKADGGAWSVAGYGSSVGGDQKPHSLGNTAELIDL